MSLIRILLKALSAIFALIVLLIVVGFMGESSEIKNLTNDNGITKIEIRKFFGRELSEAEFNESGLYHGGCTSWNLIDGRLRQEGQYENGFWNGKWKEYDKAGNIKMIREWDNGKLLKLYLPKGNDFVEVPKGQWPKYLDIQQKKPEKIKNKKL